MLVGLGCTAELAVNVMAAVYATPVCECMVPPDLHTRAPTANSRQQL